jgi:hypothetical protein
LPSHTLPTRTSRKLIEHGVRDHRGHALPLQAYAAGAEPLESMLAAMRREELEIVRDHIRIMTTKAIGKLRAILKKLMAGANDRADRR